VSREPGGLSGSVQQVASPRLGFLGVGWIGRNRLEAIVASGVAEVAVIADPVQEAVAEALAVLSGAEGAVAVGSLDELLEAGVDGLVIATPSALHAAQAVTALEQGVAVFCQKPLGRTAAEVERVVATARAADRLLGVDLSYRHTAAMRAVRELARGGELGEIYAIDLVFHNAYGPDKPWFYDPSLSGGGCVMDLGIHLVDLALWTLEGARVVEVTSRLFAGGEALRGGVVSGGVTSGVEDYGVAQLQLDSGAVVRLACSWHLPAGRDAVIEATFYGTRGGASFRNLDGSFYDFVAEHFRGTSRQLLVAPPDSWGGRAAVEWAERLAGGAGFDPGVDSVVEVAQILDRIYGR
jgi:predicted dehydrogenase